MNLRFSDTSLSDGNRVNSWVRGYPVEGRITQVFGQRSVTGSPHSGTDISALTGTPVRAPAPGVVVRVGKAGDFGNHVWLRHDTEPVMYSLYAHLNQVWVVEGQPVSLGWQLGTAGNTGKSFGSHLHWTVGRQPQVLLNPPLSGLVDPLTLLGDPPMTPEERILLHVVAQMVNDVAQLVVGHRPRKAGETEEAYQKAVQDEAFVALRAADAAATSNILERLRRAEDTLNLLSRQSQPGTPLGGSYIIEGGEIRLVRDD